MGARINSATESAEKLSKEAHEAEEKLGAEDRKRNESKAEADATSAFNCKSGAKTENVPADATFKMGSGREGGDGIGSTTPKSQGSSREGGDGIGSTAPKNPRDGKPRTFPKNKKSTGTKDHQAGPSTASKQKRDAAVKARREKSERFFTQSVKMPGGGNYDKTVHKTQKVQPSVESTEQSKE